MLLNPHDHADVAVRRELVFVETNVDGYQQLVNDLVTQHSGTVQFEVVLLDPHHDGITQIGELLAGRTGVDAIHIISHGSDGHLLLGDTMLDAQTLDSRANDIAAWSAGLSVNADILIYGCDVAHDGVGRALVDGLARLTGADVAASSDATGNIQLGGNWDLEYRAGHVETNVAFSESFQEQWLELLPNTAPTLDNTKNPMLTAINEDAGAPSGAVGTLVSALVDSSSPSGQVDNVTDPDSGTLLGIAVTATDTSMGTWYYSTDGGTNWNALGAVSDASALLLAADADTRLYFQPNADANGMLANAITFHAWDQTSGTNGSVVDLTGTQTVLDQFSVASYSNNDGTQSWSSLWTETDSAGGGPTGGSTRITGGELRVEAAGSGANYVYRQADLTGATTATLSFNYHSNLGSGDRIDVQVSNDGGATYTTLAGGTFNNTNTAPGTKSLDISAYIAANTRIRFIEVTDGYGGYAYFDNVQISATANSTGGTAAYSTASDTASLTVTAVNDAPTITSPAGVSVNESADYLFGTGVGDDLVVGDVDATTLDVTITASNGGLTLSQTTGLTFITGDGSFDTTMHFTGSIADINAALHGADYRHGLAHGSSETLSMLVSDLGATGVGGALTASATTTITIVAPSAVVGDGFLQGHYLEIGFGQNGAIGSDGAAPTGFKSAGSLLGVVVDNERDGWATYDGDFVTPGTPVETWGVSVAGTTSSNENAGGTAVTGGLVNYQSTPSGQTIEWLGHQSGLNIHQIYTVGANDLYMEVEIRLTNLSGSNLTDVYYYRNVDPDNNFSQGSPGGYATTNTIISQGNLAGASMVSATQTDGSYLGLMGFGENSRVTRGGFNNLNPLDIYNGTGGLNQTGSNTSDAAVSLAFHYDAIANGETVNLRMRYYFGSSDAAIPVVDLDADNSSGIAGGNYSASFTENSGPVTIVDADATVLSPSNGTLDSMSVTLTNLLDGNAESLHADTTGTGITAAYDSGTGVLTLSGADTADHYRTVLRTLTYDNTSDNPTETARIITLEATSGFNVSNAVTSTVSITATNDAPVITSNGGGTDASIMLAENITDVTTVTSSDPDGGTATYSLSGADAGCFTINPHTGQLRFASAPNFEMPHDADANNLYDVMVTANDGAGGTDSQDIHVAITDVNEFAISAISNTGAANNTVAENAPIGTPVGLTAFANDADGTTHDVTYALDDNANNQFAIDPATGIVTVAGSIDYEAGVTRTIVVRATSQDLSTTTQSFVIDIQNLNDNAPVATNGNYAVAEDGNLTAPVAGVLSNASDADGNSITAALDAGPNHGSLTFNVDGSFNYVPNANYFGTDSFTYHAVDSGGLASNVATVGITVNEVNDTPIASNAAATTNEDTPVSGNVLNNVTDPDNTDGITGNEDTHTAALDAGPSHGSLTFNADGTFNYTPNANYFGTDSFTYHAVDSRGAASNVAAVAITVSEVNDVPVASNTAITTNEDTPVSGNVLNNVTDPDNTDGITGNEDTHTAALDAGPSHGSLTLNTDGSFNYTPNAHFFGVDSFVYHAVDSRGAVSNIATVTVSVHETNIAPVAHDDSVVTDQNTPLKVTGLGVLVNDTDADHDSLKAQLVSGPSHGTLTLAQDGTFVYSPDSAFTGTDSFRYQANDGHEASNTVAVTITVRPLGTGVTPPNPTLLPPPHLGPPGENPHPVLPPVIGPPPPQIVTGTEPELSRVPVLPPTPSLTIIDAPLLVADLTAMQSTPSWWQVRLSDQDSVTITEEASSTNEVEVLLTSPPAIMFQVDWQWNNSPDETQKDGQSPLSLEHMAAGATVSVVSAFSVGYALWTLRGGYLLTSFLAALPAWQMIDPLPVLQSFAAAKDDDEEEGIDEDRHGQREGRSLSSFVQHRSRKVAAAAETANSPTTPHDDGGAT